MIQKKWFRIETDASGAILSCTEVDSKGRQGAVVRYYEALTKADACRQAKEWAERFRSNLRASNVRRRDRLLAAGLCKWCGKNPRVNADHCEECRVRVNKLNNQRRRDRRNGDSAPRKNLDPIQLRENVRASNNRHKDSLRAKWGSESSWVTSCLVRHLDTLGPQLFRKMLCDKIRKAGGGAALDEYERERAKQAEATFTDASKLYSKRYPEAAE